MKQRGKKKKELKEIKTTSDTSGTMFKFKCPNIQIVGVPEEDDKKKGHDKILEEIIVENFTKIGKEIATQIQETQRVPNSINPR